MPELTDDYRQIFLRGVPMLDLQGRPFGVINLDTQNPMKRFTDEDLELLLAKTPAKIGQDH